MLLAPLLAGQLSAQLRRSLAQRLASLMLFRGLRATPAQGWAASWLLVQGFAQVEGSGPGAVEAGVENGSRML